MSETRKIAAILVSDVVGYSRLAGADEERALARLRALRSDLIDPIIAVHHGRVVKRTGDGAIVEFRSVVDAVRCAIEVQHGMIERNAGLPAERRIEFRIGIHLGDVVEESDGDLMGDGVNIAARVQGLAKPGGICLSEDAYRHVRARLDLAVKDLGPTELKNIAEPIRLYSLEVGIPAQPNPTIEPKPPEPKKRSARAPLAAGIVALLILIAGGGGWYYFVAVRPATLSVKPTQAAHFSVVVLPFGLGRFDEALEDVKKAVDGGYRNIYSYVNLAAAHAFKGEMEEAKAAIAEARRLKPDLSVKWLVKHKPVLQFAFDGLRKAGLPEE